MAVQSCRWQWLATPASAPVLPALLPEQATPQPKQAIPRFEHALCTAAAPNASTVQAVMACWQPLSRSQRAACESEGILAAALAEHYLGPAQAPDGCKEHYAQFAKNRQGRIPVWITVAAERTGIRLPPVDLRTEPGNTNKA